MVRAPRVHADGGREAREWGQTQRARKYGYESLGKFSSDGSHFLGEVECKSGERHPRQARKERSEAEMKRILDI